MPQLLAFLVVAALVVPASAAHAQNGPFGPLPPPAPRETPLPEPVDNDPTGSDVSRETLFLIGAGVLAVFIGLGVAITRDARRSLTDEDRAALERAATPGERKRVSATAKERARAKTRAQRQARKRARRARR